MLSHFFWKHVSTENKMKIQEESDEEYQIDKQSLKKIPMTAALIRRKKEEELRKKYNVYAEKEGTLL